jgi:hypothetical protein
VYDKCFTRLERYVKMHTNRELLGATVANHAGITGYIYTFAQARFKYDQFFI